MGQLEVQQPVESPDQFVHSAVAQLRVSGMGHGAVGAHFRPQRSFRSQGQPVVGRLAVDEEAAALGVQIGLRAPAESRSSPTTNSSAAATPASRKPLSGGQLRGNNSLGVAGAPAIEEKIVLAAGDKRRNRIHVRGKHHIRLLAMPAYRLNRGPLIAALRRLGNLRPFHGKAPLLSKASRYAPTAPSL